MGGGGCRKLAREVGLATMGRTSPSIGAGGGERGLLASSSWAIRVWLHSHMVWPHREVGVASVGHSMAAQPYGMAAQRGGLGKSWPQWSGMPARAATHKPGGSCTTPYEALCTSKQTKTNTIF
jgi:hypothetical protein